MRNGIRNIKKNMECDNMNIGSKVKKLIKEFDVSKLKVTYTPLEPKYNQAISTGIALARKEYKVAALMVGSYIIYKYLNNKNESLDN